MRRVYVAHPIGADDGGRRARIQAAVDAGAALLVAGLAPFVPGLWAASRAYIDADAIAAYDDWLEYDFAWLRQCHAVLRLPGHSPGADREVEEAQRLGMPVFFSVDEVLAWAGTPAVRAIGGAS